jgi:hypothetical protein
VDREEKKDFLSSVIKFAIRLNYKIISVSSIGYESVYESRLDIPVTRIIQRSLYHGDDDDDDDDAVEENEDDQSLVISLPWNLFVQPKRLYIKFSSNLNSELITNYVDHTKSSGSPIAAFSSTTTTDAIINDFNMSLVDGISFLAAKKVKDPHSFLVTFYSWRLKRGIGEMRRQFLLPDSSLL